MNKQKSNNKKKKNSPSIRIHKHYQHNMSNNEKITTDQYGRKKWNLEAYAEEAKLKKKPTVSETIPAHQIEDDSSSLEYIKQRNKLLDQLIKAVKKYNLITPELSTTTTTYGKNKRFGFFCPICDVSFRDNLLLIDHLNSPQHISKLNQVNSSKGDTAQNQELLEGGIRRASLQEVVSTMERLVAKSIREKNSLENDQSGLLFQERVEKRRQFEEKKKQKRNNRKNVQKQRKKQKLEHDSSSANDDINKLMGFGRFGTTKS